MHRLFILGLIFIHSYSFAQVTLKQVDPFYKVMQNEKNVAAFNEVYPVAYDEVLTVQLLLQSTQKKEGVTLSFSSPTISKTILDSIRVFRQGYIKVSPKIHAPSKDKISAPNNLFPDPLYAGNLFSLTSGINVPVVIEIPITDGIPAGVHLVIVTAKDAMAKTLSTTNITFQLYNVKVPDTKLNYVNWYHDFDYELMNNGKAVKAFSAEYWVQFKKIVQATKDYGQNIFAINPLYLIQFKKNKNAYAADYTHLDKAIDIITKEVGLSYVLARQFAIRTGGWESQFALQIPKFYSETAYMMVTKPFNDDEVQKFYNWFLPSYHMHLKAKGILGKYLHHIADEPIKFNEKSYKEIAGFIRKKMPGLKTIEAVNDANLASYIDILVLQLGELSFRYDDVMKKVRAAKKEIWFYTGSNPQGEYANRFIELPLIKTRLLPWVAARYGLNGYLHWGLNFWGKKPFEDATKIQFDKPIELPGGDAYIIYPGYQSVVLSTRFLEMRNGINDVALLMLLKQKNPSVAKSITQQIVQNFQNYNTNTRFFIAKKKEILEQLSK